ATLLLAVLYFLWHQPKVSSLLSSRARVLCDAIIARLAHFPSESSRRWLRFALFLLQDFAFVNPALHSDHTIRSASFGEAILDIGAQRVQRQTALQIPLGARDFVAVQSSADADFDAFAAEAQRRVHCLAHGAAEAHALFQ